MTRTIEDLLAASMREEAAGLRPAPDLVARAARQHRRRTRNRITASAAGTVGVAAAVTIGVTVTSPAPNTAGTTGAAGTGSSAASAKPGGQAATTPQARLMAAMTASAQQSYRLHLVNTGTTPGHQMTPASPRRDLIGWYADYTGVYDPATHSGAGVNTHRASSGTLANPKDYGQPEGYTQVRIVGGSYYVRDTGDTRWLTGQGTLVQALVLNGGSAWAPTDGSSADPAVLMAAARRLGSVTSAGKTGSGAQALDTYHFSYEIPGDGSVKSHRLTGTITVHDQSNLIAAITMQTTVTGAHPELGDGDPLTFKTVMTFSDYGLPVSVQAPAGARKLTGFGATQKLAPPPSPGA